MSKIKKVSISEEMVGNGKEIINQGKISFFIAIFFLGIMMLYNLQHSALWGDEWVEYYYSQKNIWNGDLYKAIISTFQPPLYNFLMHFWLAVNDSILWFRFFNIVLGIMSGIFLYKTVEEIGNCRYAFFSLISLGCTYQWIYCVQECSEYTLMLTFLFGAFYFYIRKEKDNSFKNQLYFIGMCIGAIYSQYGAFFVIGPLLVINYIRCWKTRKQIKFMHITGAYLGAFICFALPLLLLFVKNQMSRNGITDNATILISKDTILNFLLVFGNLLGYLFNVDHLSVIKIIIQFVAVFLLFSGIVILLRKKMVQEKKDVIITLYVSYILYYFLVIFHIYAMVHPNQSSGFYSRYAYFFIPLLWNVISIIVYEINEFVKGMFLQVNLEKIMVVIILIISLCSLPSIIENWNKSYDDEFFDIWLNNSGYNDTTYLIGVAFYGFNHYLANSDCLVQGNIIYAKDEPISQETLPQKFWLWRTNWSGEAWQETIDIALEKGYEVEVFADHGYQGQLARCSKIDSF